MLGFVGKPSSGKSSFLNACSKAKAKIGNYSFTTIDPNHGISFYQVDCPCVKYNLTDSCKPRYGKCINGVRYIPIKVLDVAGLIPGASEGLGLGNKFLDDLRSANVLLHIIDSSGNTDEKGEATSGYDPINDAEWLDKEIHAWIFNNLWKKWGSIIKRHKATKSTAFKTLQLNLSGYGANASMINKVLDYCKITEPNDLPEWDEEKLNAFVWDFMKIRFPTILVLNKVDVEGADANIANICSRYQDRKIVTTSALSEIFLQKLTKQKFIHYVPGSEFFDTKETLQAENNPLAKKLLPITDQNVKDRLESIQDGVLLRYGSTGVLDAIKTAVKLMSYFPVYVVPNVNTFSDRNGKAFKDCVLVPKGTTVLDILQKFLKTTSENASERLNYAETQDGVQIGEDELLTEKNNIIKFTLHPEVENNNNNNQSNNKKKEKIKKSKKKNNNNNSDNNDDF